MGTTKKLAGVSKIHLTPASGRLSMTIDKPTIKQLKKICIDLELDLETVMDFSIYLLNFLVKRSPVDMLEEPINEYDDLLSFLLTDDRSTGKSCLPENTESNNFDNIEQ